jgi:hypothetical protein
MDWDCRPEARGNNCEQAVHFRVRNAETKFDFNSDESMFREISTQLNGGT